MISLRNGILLIVLFTVACGAPSAMSVCLGECELGIECAYLSSGTNCEAKCQEQKAAGVPLFSRTEDCLERSHERVECLLAVDCEYTTEDPQSVVGKRITACELEIQAYYAVCSAGDN